MVVAELALYNVSNWFSLTITNAAHLDQQVLHAQCFPVIVLSGSHRVDRRAQDLYGSVEIRPSSDLLLSLLDVSNDQFVIRAIVGIDLELLHLLQRREFSKSHHIASTHTTRTYDLNKLATAAMT